MKMRTYALLFFAFSLAASSLTWGASPVARRGLPKGVYSPFPAPPSVRLSNGLNLDASGNLMINAGLGGGGTSLSNGLSVDSSGNLLVNCATGCNGSATSVPWSGLQNSAGNLSLSMAGFTTTYNFTSPLANAFSWINTTAATNVANQNSPQLNIASNYWSGASSQNSWTIQQICGAGTNPACNLTLAQSGSSGGGAVVAPLYVTNGAGGGYKDYGQGTDPNLTALGFLNEVGWGAPATVPTSYLCLMPGAVPLTGANILVCGGAANARGNYSATWQTLYMPRASACPSNLDTILSTDDYGYVTWSDASSCAVTLPQASTLPTNFFFNGCNINAGAVTITPTTSTISYTNGGNYLAGQASVSLSKGQCAQVYSDNTNFFANVNTANATTLNGATVPASAALLGTNGSSQGVAVTVGTGVVTALGDNTNATGGFPTVPVALSTVAALSTVNPQAATYQVLAADFQGYNTITVASGTFNITLVASGSQPAAGRYINIINYGSGVVSILSSGQNINGASTTLTMPAGGQGVPVQATIISDGTNYFASLNGANTVNVGGAAVPSGCNMPQTNASRQFVCQGSIALSAGKFTTFNAETTAGVSTVYERGVTSQKAETGTADASVLAVTPASAIGTYRACVAISVSSATSGVIGWTLSWTDSSANAQSNIAQSLFQQGTAAPANTFTTSAAGNYNSCAEFDVNAAGAAITVKWVGGGTTTAKMSAVVERLQ